MIICNLKGGFGNHLMCFSLATILAEKYNIKIKLIDNCIKNDELYQRNDTRITLNKIVNQNYICNNEPNNSLIIINDPSKYNQVLNNLNINNDYIIDIIHIKSFSIYINNVNIIKKFLHVKSDKNYLNSIVVSLRLGMGVNEVAQPSPFEKELRLPFIYYEKSIKYLMDNYDSITQLIILSDNYSNNYINNFFNFNSKLNIILCNDKNTYEQFNIITQSSYFISSNSSFSIFGSILNTDAIKIIMPFFIDSGCCFPGVNNKSYTWYMNDSKNCMNMII
jgi:hypothetical protein